MESFIFNLYIHFSLNELLKIKSLFYGIFLTSCTVVFKKSLNNMYYMHPNYGEPETILKMLFSKPTDKGILQIYIYFFKIKSDLFKTVSAYFMAIYVLLQLLIFRCNCIKPIENMSRLHFINSFNDFEVLGLTVSFF